MSDYRVLRDFAFEGKVFKVGDSLRPSDPLEGRIIREWPWPSSFLSGAGTHRPTRRTPPAEAGCLAAST